MRAGCSLPTGPVFGGADVVVLSSCNCIMHLMYHSFCFIANVLFALGFSVTYIRTQAYHDRHGRIMRHLLIRLLPVSRQQLKAKRKNFSEETAAETRGERNVSTACIPLDHFSRQRISSKAQAVAQFINALTGSTSALGLISLKIIEGEPINVNN